MEGLGEWKVSETAERLAGLQHLLEKAGQEGSVLCQLLRLSEQLPPFPSSLRRGKQGH